MITNVDRRETSDQARPARRGALRAFGLAVLGLLVPLLALERRMKRTGGPGIIAFELAGTPDRAGRIMGAWGTEGRSAARLSLVLDFPFLVAYSGLHVNVCGIASDVLGERGWERAAALGGIARTSQVVAGACDAVENAALLGVLAGRDNALPRIARSFAMAKFALLAVGSAYAAAGLTAISADADRTWNRHRHGSGAHEPGSRGTREAGARR